MTKLRNFTLPFSLLIFLTGCGLFESTSDKVVGRFNVSFVDDVNWRSLSLDNGILVEPYVFAVGHNEKYIIAKQHPCPRDAFKINTRVTKYFIINISDVDFKGNGMYSSLEKSEFDSLVSLLKIEDIKFDMNYPEQPHVFAR
jgi:hypothetical protein